MISRPIQISSSVGLVQTILGFPSLIIGHELRAQRIPVQASTLASVELGRVHWRDLASPGSPTSRRDSKQLLRPFLSHLKGISEATRRGHCGSKAPARSDCAIKQIAHARCRRGVSEKTQDHHQSRNDEVFSRRCRPASLAWRPAPPRITAHVSCAREHRMSPNRAAVWRADQNNVFEHNKPECPPNAQPSRGN